MLTLVIACTYYYSNRAPWVYTVHVFKNDAPSERFSGLVFAAQLRRKSEDFFSKSEGFFQCCGMLLLKKPSEDVESF